MTESEETRAGEGSAAMEDVRPGDGDDGAVDGRLAEMREMIAALGGREGIERLVALRDKAEDDEAAAALAAGDLEKARAVLREAAESRVQARLAELEDRLEAAEAERDRLVADMRAAAVEQAVREAAAQAEVDPDMVPFLLEHVRDRLTLRDGRVVAADGGDSARGAAEVIADMRRDGSLPAAFFRVGSGGGAPGSGGGPAGVANPWAPESYNLTRQGELLRSNPALARSLAGEAGVTLA